MIELFLSISQFHSLFGMKSQSRIISRLLDSFEAAIWCLLNTASYKECMLRAVNLGDDSDTVAAIAGGLAGLYYGYESIPKDWLDVIKRREWIEKICEKTEHKYS